MPSRRSRQTLGYAVACAVFVSAAPGISAESNRTTDPSAGWWTMDLHTASKSYQLLFHRQQGTINRIKFEQIVYRRQLLVCEYFEEPERAEAQRFNPKTGRFIETIADLQPFRALSAHIAAKGEEPPGSLRQKSWWRRDTTLVALARDALRACRGQPRPRVTRG